MEAKATLNQYRQAPRKVRLVANLVKGKSVEYALLELNNRSRRAAPMFAKLIQSAVANAKVSGLDMKALMVKDIRVDKGPIMKRSMPRAHGRAFPIHKHTSHVTVLLSDGGASEAKGKKETTAKSAPKALAAKKKPTVKAK